MFDAHVILEDGRQPKAKIHNIRQQRGASPVYDSFKTHFIPGRGITSGTGHFLDVIPKSELESQTCKIIANVQDTTVYIADVKCICDEHAVFHFFGGVSLTVTKPIPLFKRRYYD